MSQHKRKELEILMCPINKKSKLIKTADNKNEIITILNKKENVYYRIFLDLVLGLFT